MYDIIGDGRAGQFQLSGLSVKGKRDTFDRLRQKQDECEKYKQRLTDKNKEIADLKEELRVEKTRAVSG